MASHNAVVSARSADYSYPAFYKYDVGYTPVTNIKDAVKAKHLDIFEKIITKIIDIVVDKLVIAFPILIRKLISVSIGDVGGYGGYSKELEPLKNLGIFGYIPLLIIKIANGFSGFIDVLQRNKFIKNTLVPILIVLGVAGLAVFLVWWLQPTEGRDAKGYYPIQGYGPPYNYEGPAYTSYSARHNYGDPGGIITNPSL